MAADGFFEAFSGEAVKGGERIVRIHVSNVYPAPVLENHSLHSNDRGGPPLLAREEGMGEEGLMLENETLVAQQI